MRTINRKQHLQILSTVDTPPYSHGKIKGGGVLSKLRHYFSRPSHPPEVMIRRPSLSLRPGECWAFSYNTGRVQFGLPGRIHITHVTYEHLARSQSINDDLSSAPRQFQLWVGHSYSIGYGLHYSFAGSQREEQSAAANHRSVRVRCRCRRRDADLCAERHRICERSAASSVTFLALQPFAARPWTAVELRVLSNHNNPRYTCLYRLRVHGDRVV